MVRVGYTGRLGNNMFQYALGRIIAEQKKYSLVAPSIALFKNATNIEGINVEYNPLLINEHQFVDIEQILQHDGKIIFENYGQRFEYYKNYIEDIKKWFFIDEEKYIKPNIEDLVIHLRLEDFDYHNLILDPQKILNCALSLKYKKGYIVTHDIHHPQVKIFKDAGFELFHKNIIEDFVFMKNASQLIISQSTYSWWAGILGNATVYSFISDSIGHWKINPSKYEINLITDLDRFKYIEF